MFGVKIDTEMAEKYAKQQQPVVCAQFALEHMPQDVSTLMLSQWSALMVMVTLTFDLLTLKLVCELHQRWGTVLPNLGTLCLWVLELFAICTRRTDGQTDRRTDKNNAY